MDGFGTGSDSCRECGHGTAVVALHEGGDRWKKRVTGGESGMIRERVILGVLDWSGFHIFRARPTGRWSSSDRKIRQRRIIGRRYYAFRCFAATRYAFASSLFHLPRLLRLTFERFVTIRDLRHDPREIPSRESNATIESGQGRRVESRLLSTIDSRGKGRGRGSARMRSARCGD